MIEVTMGISSFYKEVMRNNVLYSSYSEMLCMCMWNQTNNISNPNILSLICKPERMLKFQCLDGITGACCAELSERRRQRRGGGASCPSCLRLI